MSTLFSTYYDKLIAHASAQFVNLVQTRKCIEDCLKTEKIKDYPTPFEQSSSGIGGSTKKNFSNKRNEKNEKEVMQFLNRLPSTSSYMLRTLPQRTISVLNTNCGQGTIMVDNYPFSIVKTYHLSIGFAKRTEKKKWTMQTYRSRFVPGIPWRGFTRPMTSLECETNNIYHRFKVSKKADHVRRHGRHGKCKDKSNPSTSDNISESPRSSESKMIREGVRRDFPKEKDMYLEFLKQNQDVSA